ncbi:MAG: TetR/AcrR family transcriptional regulator [Deltaproteobacteria bacterium]|nr:TetR/AcrR family transcriptional regulator [Deltaproteobacteria bacterium]
MVAQRQKTKQTKERLLSAAFELLKSESCNGLTASKITTAAGISKGGLFHHFSTIEDFYLHMLDSIIQSFDVELKHEQPESLEDFLSKSLEFTFDMMDANPEIMVFIYYFIDLSRFNPSYAAKIREIMEAGFDRWKTDFARYWPPGISQERQDGMIYLIDMYFAGLSTHYMIFGNKDRYKAITREFIAMLGNYLKGDVS